MRKVILDNDVVRERGLISNGYCLPYNPKLVARANELRKHMTPAERKLWTEFFRNSPFKVVRQRVIDNYIADFYCAKFGLVIEIDGGIHDTEEAQRYDEERSRILENYNLKIIHFKNAEVEKEFDKVCMKIMEELQKIEQINRDFLE